MNNWFSSINGTPTAIITHKMGNNPAERIMGQIPRDVKLEVFNGNIPFFPDISIKNNTEYIKLAVGKEGSALFDELLKVAKFERNAYNHAFRKDMDSEKQLWGVILTMLSQPQAALLIDPLTGMKAKTREAFVKVLDICRNRDIKVIYTAQSLKDVLQLEMQQNVIVLKGDNYILTSSDKLQERKQEMGEAASYEDLYKELAGD